MLDLDRWNEVFSTLRNSKLRTLMTACGVFWGMFMLVLMLGFGNGLQLGVQTNMMGFATNSVYVWSQTTTLPYRGNKPGRRIKYTMDDVAPVQALPGVSEVAPRIQLGGHRDGNPVTYNGKTAGFGVVGDIPEAAQVESIYPYAGRFINQRDLDSERKVAVIGDQVRHILFGEDAEPVGEFISVRGVYFRVVGVFRSESPGDSGERNNSRVHLPLSTLRGAFNQGNRIGWFAIGADPNADAEEVERAVRSTLAARHGVHPDDTRGIGSFNAAKQFRKMQRLFGGIAAFTWFVSLATLLAGILGVSNVMLISVKERTREFGVRKALGATPLSVVSLVLQEAMVLTSVAGYSGLVAGVGILELSGRLATGTGPLGAPSIDLFTAVIAALVLVATGLIAGIAPASHAASIRPVEALRSE